MVDSVCVVGLGYIGLPTAVAFATQGLHVTGVDINSSTVDMVRRGEAPFIEPDLAVALSGAVAMGLLTAVTEPVHAGAFVIAVPTPVRADKSADLSYVKAAGEAIAPMLQKGSLVILESTCPPGTTRSLSQSLAGRRPDLAFPHTSGDLADVNVAYCPERVLPGRIMIELIANDRVVGGVSPRCAARASELYKVFCQGSCVETTATTAELVKLSENAYRDINIAYANELSRVCDGLDADVHTVIELANLHPRVDILKPGPGVGGHCIAVDPWFIVSAAPNDCELIPTARHVNDERPRYVADQILKQAQTLTHPIVACLGLAFKANVDDLRESPSIEIVRQLALTGDLDILVVEPHVAELPVVLRELGNVSIVSADEALAKSGMVVALVAHDQFKEIQPPQLGGKLILDTCGIWR